MTWICKISIKLYFLCGPSKSRSKILMKRLVIYRSIIVKKVFSRKRKISTFMMTTTVRIKVYWKKLN